MSHILALDQGTTSSRAIIYNADAEPIGTAQQEFQQLFPQPGWVEHDASEIWQSQLTVAKKVIAECGLTSDDISGLGITNQRETTILWNKRTGEPIHNAIVWQDRRTSSYCNSLTEAGHAELIRAKTGLVIDAYFSGTKVNWLLDNIEGARAMADAGELLFGTVDCWLIWKLTNGEKHITDVSNASRTLLFNIHTLEWDQQLLDLMDIPSSILPHVTASSGDLGTTSSELLGSEIPIAGIAGDQQAALFGQMCLTEGMAKSTYGTGCFLVVNTGNQPVESKHKLLTTIGWKIGDAVTYALEGSVFVGGAVVQWLRDELEFFSDASESEALASSVDDTGGVYFVPALTGLGAPYWDQDARGLIVGITRGTSKAHITRAALEAICYQVNDVLEIMGEDMGSPILEVRVDGGAVANNLLVQFQSDIAQTQVVRPTNLETTALGAAYLAGIGVGLWNLNELKEKWIVDRVFTPQMEQNDASALKSKWKQAVERAKNWA
jgi:glycerol kinase